MPSQWLISGSDRLNFPLEQISWCMTALLDAVTKKQSTFSWKTWRRPLGVNEDVAAEYADRSQVGIPNCEKISSMGRSYLD